MELEEEELDEAEEIAEAELKDALSALNLNAKSPYIAEILRFEGEENGRGVGSNSSAWVVAHVVDDVVELKANDVALANDVLPKLSGSATARAATQFIRRAVLLSEAAVIIPELWPAALLSYFMAIERISDDLTKELRKEAELDLAEKTNAAAAGLRIKLIDDSITDADAVELIRDVSKEFSRIRFFYADLKVRRAGTELQLDPDLVEKAQAFGRFRNDYLGHPRTQIPSDESNRWINDDLAFRLSNEFLRAYLQRSVTASDT